MHRLPQPSTVARLETERNIWFSTVRPNGRPHLVPVWFVWHDQQIFVCMQEQSVKAKNLDHCPQLVLSLEDGSNVVICEGVAERLAPPYPVDVVHKFKQKYDWDIPSDADYQYLVKITPEKWMIWLEEEIDA